MTALVCGVGTNDVPNIKDRSGRNIPSYNTWRMMLMRCYVTNHQEKHPTYIGCSVSDEWLILSNFKAFHDEHHYHGSELDKDLLFPGNKIYCKERCLFIPQELNRFVRSSPSKKSGLPAGVKPAKRGLGFEARTSIDGSYIHIGTFSTAQEAHLAWQKKKVEIAKGFEHTCMKLHPDLFAGLMMKIEYLKEF